MVCERCIRDAASPSSARLPVHQPLGGLLVVFEELAIGLAGDDIRIERQCLGRRLVFGEATVFVAPRSTADLNSPILAAEADEPNAAVDLFDAEVFPGDAGIDFGPVDADSVRRWCGCGLSWNGQSIFSKP
jgi:hypothetical protein